MSRAASAHSSGNSSDEATTSRADALGGTTEAKGSRAASSVGKKSKKRDKEAKKELQRALANAKIWETRLDVCERSRLEYRTTAKRLVMENEELRGQMKQTEHDTIDVITYLKKEDQDKDEQIFKLQQEMKRVRLDAKRDKAELIDSCNQKILRLEEELDRKSQELDVMKGELKLVKEFRRKRAAMQKELDEIKDAFDTTTKEHKSRIHRMEQKFFEEKMRLQQEANQKIAELAERAHSEAIKNLDETTKDVYKENVRANEALSYHITKGDELDKLKSALLEENQTLREEKEIHNKLIEDRVKQAKQDRDTIKALRENVETLERSLNLMVLEFDRDRQTSLAEAERKMKLQGQECERLKTLLSIKGEELQQIKRLGRRILHQRSEVETFFHTALEEVRREIKANQAVYVRESQRIYTTRMREAALGRDSFPPVRTFTKGNAMTSTNTVFKDLEGADDFDLAKKGSSSVDVAEMTWEQKERVLRALFAMMNSSTKKRKTASEDFGASTLRPTPAFLEATTGRRPIPIIADPTRLAIEPASASASTDVLFGDIQQSVTSNFSDGTTPRISDGTARLEASGNAGANLSISETGVGVLSTKDAGLSSVFPTSLPKALPEIQVPTLTTEQNLAMAAGGEANG